MLGKVKHYKTRKTTPVAAEIMAAFMVSGRGYYNGNADLAALGALEHVRDLALVNREKAAYWMDVHDVLKMWGMSTPREN
jgi:hypothetical protein